MAARPLSGRDRGEGGETVEHRFADTWGTHFKWLKWLALGRVTVGDVRIEGVSFRFGYGQVMIVVRGLRLTDAKWVVAFGSAESLYDALRNITLAMEKNQWKPDKFRKELV